MSWISELIRQKKYPVGPQKLRSIGPLSQNFSKIVPMSLDSEIFSVFIQSQESKTQLKIFEYIRIFYEYSNIFVTKKFDIRIRILDIRQKIFEYIRIFVTH